MDVQTYFFRRTNINAAGRPRSWTDHLLWHHAAHTVDLFQYQSGEPVTDCYAVQGPIHPTLGIAMDVGILLKSASGAILMLSLSFNNDGPIGSFFRYLTDGKSNPIDLSRVDVSIDGVRARGSRVHRRHLAKARAELERRSSATVHAHTRPAGKDHRSGAPRRSLAISSERLRDVLDGSRRPCSRCYRRCFGIR